jgi:hypothetical protein
LALPVNVDGIGRRLNAPPEDLSDADLRRALAIVAADYDPDGMPAINLAAFDERTTS